MMMVALRPSFTSNHLAMPFTHLSMGSLQVNKLKEMRTNITVILYISCPSFLDAPSLFAHRLSSIKPSTTYIEIPTHDFAGSGVRNAAKKLDVPVTLVAGKNTIDLLSLTVGLQVELS